MGQTKTVIERRGDIIFLCPICRDRLVWDVEDEVYEHRGCCGVVLRVYTADDGIHMSAEYEGEHKKWLITPGDAHKVTEVE